MEYFNFKEFIIKHKDLANRIFLLKKTTKKCGFFIYNKNLAFVTVSETSEKNSIATKYVEYVPNIEITSVYNCPSFEKGKYDFLILKEQENDEIINSFTKLCDLYAHNPSVPFDEFIQSIVDLFQLTRTQSLLDCIGLFGELVLLKTFFENGINLSSFWHQSGIYSKYDISMPNINVEIKTSISDSTTFKIKHSQIFNKDKNVVALVSLRSTEATGLSLSDLVSYFRNTKPFSENLRFLIALEKELQKKIEPDTFRKHFALNDIYCFDCSKIKTLTNIPFNITDIVYDYCFDINDSFDINDFARTYLR